TGLPERLVADDLQKPVQREVQRHGKVRLEKPLPKIRSIQQYTRDGDIQEKVDERYPPVHAFEVAPEALIRNGAERIRDRNNEHKERKHSEDPLALRT